MPGGSSRRTGASWHSSLSRLFARSPSREPQQEGGAAAPPHSCETKENESTSVISQRKESNPELLKTPLCEKKNLSTEDLSISITQEELKKANSLPSLAHEKKATNNDRQIKEGFFQYLGSLFGIPSKSSWKETDQSSLRAGHSRTEKDSKNPADNHESIHTEYPKQEIFVISTPGSAQEALNTNKDSALIESTSSGSQKVQEQPDGLPKKTECELVAPAVTYSTYRGSARIKQLLKKQAELEQTEEISSSINDSPIKIKENQTVSHPNSETAATKKGSSLKGASKAKIKDDKKDTHLLAEMDKNSQNASEKTTLLPEMKTIKNCSEELVSVENVFVSETPEVNKNLLVEPVLSPKDATVSCQSIDPIEMYSTNSRLLEKERVGLEEIRMQLQSNNATIVGSEKGMPFCALANTETTETMQSEFSSYPKPDCTHNERQLLQDNSCSEDQFQVKSVDQTLYWKSSVCSGQAAGSTDSHKNVVTTQKEQTPKFTSSDACVLPHEQREEPLQVMECNSASNVRTDLPTSAQSTETVQDVDMDRKSHSESEEATESVIHGGTHNTCNFSVISDITIKDDTIENCSVPLTKFNHVEVTNILLKAREVNNVSTSPSVDEYENVENCALCVSSLETDCAHTDKAVTVNDAPLILQAKDVVRSPVISAEINDMLVHEIKNYSEVEMASAVLESKELCTIGPSSIPSEDMCLLKGFSPAVKPEHNSSSAFSPLSASDLGRNSLIFGDKIISLDNMSKPVPDFEDQSLWKTSGLPAKQEDTSIAETLGAIDSSDVCYSNTHCSAPGYETGQGIKKSEVCQDLSAAESVSADQISNPFLEPGDTLENKVISDVHADVRSLLCSEETKDTIGSCPLGSGSNLTRENISVSVSDDVHSNQPTSTTSIKDTSEVCFPTCERIDVALDKINFISINSDNKGKMPPKHKSSSLPSELTSELANLTPFSASVSHIAGKPVKKEHLTPSRQATPHYLAALVSKNPVEIDDQAIIPLFTKPSSQFSEETLKDVETGKQVLIKSQDLTVLFKKADEIVDAVLLLAIEEIRSKQAAGACQTNDIKDCLLGPSLQKDQKTQEMPLESKEIRLKNSSLKYFNESGIRTLSGVNGKDTVGTGIQDETIPVDVNDKIDLHSSILQQAKEIVDDVINRAVQKLPHNQCEHHVGVSLSQNTEFRPQTDALERLSTATELTVKPSKIIEDPLKLSPEFPAVVHNIIGEYEVANSSALLYFHPKNDSKGITTGEMAPDNVVSSSKKVGESFDSTTRLKSSHEETGKGKSVCDGTYMTDASDKASNWTGDSESEYSLHILNGENVMIEEQLSSCSSVPRNVLPISSNVNSRTCLSSNSKDDCGHLDLCGSNEEKDLLKYICKVNQAAAFVPEELHETYDEIDKERGHCKIESACSALQDKNSSQFHISESSVMDSSAMISLNADFTFDKAAIIGSGLTGTSVLEDDEEEDYDRKKSSHCFAFSPEEKWEGNSSFTILYEGTLQNERISFSTEESENPLSSLPDFSLDNIEHLLMPEAAKSKLQSVQPFEESNQFNPNLDHSLSESFMTVEAKRYKVYPFNLSPIYEDDSSQEDLTADISPGCSGGKSRDCGNQYLSVLSLLQSVSERLKSSECCGEEELCEENKLEDEKETHISQPRSHNLSMAVSENIHERTSLSKHSPFFPKEAFSADEPLSFSRLHLPKSNPRTKAFSRTSYYECLQSSRRYSGEKGTRFGSTLLPEDPLSEDEGLQKRGDFGTCPVDRKGLKCNPRPGKVVICDVHDNKNKHEIYHDVLDATEWIFSNKVLIKVVRGCWILYEEPEFQGQKYVLEEGEEVTHDIWNPNSERHQEHFTIGSIRLVRKNCSVPEIELYSQVDTVHFPICIQSAVANLEELEVMNPTLSVKAGVWLAYSDVNYKGEVMILEENHSPCEISAADVKSFHPLKMGGLKVQMPMNIEIIIYERPQFGGSCKELSENIDCVATLFRNADDFQGIGSIRVIGGVWVGYEKERYKGRQYLLEEGEYEDWQSWGGENCVLLSFRFLQADFMKSEITLFEMDEENGKLLDIVNQEIPDLEQAGFGLVTRSVTVKSGAWVAYQQKNFCGEQYILEKGKYKCFFDWGGSSETIMSVRPIKLEPLGNHEPTHWIKAFSSTHFQGLCVDFTTEVTDFGSFTPRSFKVLRGCWLLSYQGETADNQCVLEEDLYNDLGSCGCPVAAIKSLKPIEYIFAEPFISLFTLENCEGRELNVHEAYSSVLNKDLHFLTQSVWVRSGLWIAYEGSNFLGKQILLESSKISSWAQFSGWKAIGSLRPVKQPAAYFRIKNRSQDKYLTVAGNLIDARASSVYLSPLNGKDTQIWFYCCGLIKSKVNDACLDVIGGRDAPGAKVALWVEHGKARQKWTFNKDGTISSYLSDQLVLDTKGGYYYDRNHIIINQLNTSECSQKWDFEIL